MSRVLTVNYNKKPSYDIVIGNDYSELADRVKALGFEGKKAVIITDSTVKDLYAEALKTELEKACSKVFIYAFEAGEQNKNLSTVQKIISFMIENKINRNDLAVAVGGGVVGDVAGFCASIYLRGIEFIQIPTTLLAQVDSSIGGKTGVDFDQYKNMVGAFKMPKLVYINTKTLSTLDARQFYAGMGEVMKYGLIMDESFFEWLISKMYEIHDRDNATLEEMIETCCICKQKIVERDPLEKGDRALLNFGHTIGHAIEKYKNFELLHGECVALGCVAASYISWQKNKLSKDEYYEIRDMFVPFNLPISIDDLEPEKIVELTKSDKKSMDGGIKFILLKRVGKAYIDQTVTDEEMIAGINEINFTEEDEKA
ncbi:MAG: 3-dehydroquinate synthase [Lachnospiraceae bacterium]|nr:3-dehydroquinate synthase [Lachnospiraceae bacterium]